MSKQIEIESDEYIGAVKLGGKWRLFYEVMSMWILDYASYDPDYDPSDPKYNSWRKDLLVVDVNNSNEYCRAMEAKELFSNQISSARTEFGTPAKLTFVTNFDEKIYVSGWHDNIALQNYVPTGWKSMEGNPYEYVPSEIAELFASE